MASSPLLRACDSCGCTIASTNWPVLPEKKHAESTDVTPTTSQALLNDTHTGLFSGISEQFSHLGTDQVDGHKVDNPTGQYMNSSVTQVFVGYGINDRFSIQVNLPIITRSFRRPTDNGVETGEETGMGDLCLIANVMAYRYDDNDLTFVLNVQGGLKLPTGDASRIKEELNEHDDAPEIDPETGEEIPHVHAPPSGVHGHDLALGSGSFDGLVGETTFLRYQRFLFTTSLQYAIRSRGIVGYEYANEINWTAGPGVFLLLDHDATVSLQLMASGMDKGMDTLSGQKQEDTGLSAVYLGPQLNATIGKDISANIGVDVPVVMDNTSFQTTTDYRVRAGLTIRY